MLLEDKSIPELRSIADAMGIPNVFAMDQKELINAINVKAPDVLPEPSQRVEYIAVMDSGMTDATEDDVIAYLSPLISRGLSVEFGIGEWFMRAGTKEDSGTMRQPLLNILRCGEKLMATGVVRDGI